MSVPAVIPPPEPLVPPDCNLQHYGWFKLHHKRLRKSAWWLRASDTAKAVSVELWCAAFEELPTASLPDDDIALSDLAGYGRRDLSAWKAVKDEVMSAWVLCTDGRWYHPTLAESANEAWAELTGRREFERDRKRRQREKSQGDSANAETVAVVEVDEKPAEAVDVVPVGHGHREENRTEQIEIEEPLSPTTVGAKKTGKAPVAPKAPKATRATRIPFGWTASVDERKYATDRGFGPEEVREMEDAFFDWWKACPGAKGTKQDWSATWRTWVRTEAKRRGGRYGQSRGANGSGPGGVGGGRPSAGGGDRQDRIAAMHAGAMAALDRRR